MDPLNSSAGFTQSHLFDWIELEGLWTRKPQMALFTCLAGDIGNQWVLGSPPHGHSPASKLHQLSYMAVSRQGPGAQGGNGKTSSMSRRWNWTIPLPPHAVAQSKSQVQPRIHRAEDRLHPLMGITARNVWPDFIDHRVKGKFWGEFCNVG